MTIKRIAAAAFLGLSGLLAPMRAHGAPPLVAVVGKPTVTLCATCAAPAARVEIVLRDDVLLPAIKIESVLLSGGYDQNLQDAFVARLEPQGSRPTAIVLVPRQGLGKSGIYDVALSLTTADGKERQPLTVSITQPSGKLSLPGILHVDRTLDPIFGTDDVTPLLTLFETSNASAVNITDARMVQRFRAGAQPVEGTVTFRPPVSVPAGRTADLGYQLEGTFPLGVSTATAQVYSDQLADGVPVTLEIRTHRAAWFIIVAVALGLLVSWLLKVKIQGRIDFLTAEDRAKDLKARVVQLLADNQDADLTRSIGAELQALEGALAKQDAKAIEEARAALDAKVQSELQALLGRRKPVADKLQEWTMLAGTSWSVMPSITRLLSELAGDLAPVTANLARNDVSTVVGQLADLRRTFPAKFGELSREWVQSVEDIFFAIEQTRDGMSQKTVGWWTEQVAKARAAIASARFSNDAADVADLATGARNISAARQASVDFFHALGRALQTDAMSAAAQLGQASGSRGPDVAALPSYADAAAKVLIALSDSPESWPTAGRKALDALREAWRGALLKEVSDTDARGSIAKLLDAGESDKALRETLLAIAAESGNDGVDFAAVRTLSGSFHALYDFPAQVPRGTAAAPIMLATSLPFLSWSRSSEHAYNTQTELFWAKAKQTLILGAIICVLGYTTYAAKFVGTFDELASIFFWAFGLDLTLDAVTRVSRK